MIDPFFTKVALCKLKNSNKYGIYTFSEHTDKLKRRFEQLTGLCSCVHIDFDNVNRVKATFNYGFVNIYFAINVPIKKYFCATTNQSSEIYEFFKISDINHRRNDIEKFVKTNIHVVKDYCNNKTSSFSPNPICENCVTFYKDKHVKRIRLVIFDHDYKSFILFKKDDVFDFPYESSNEQLTEKDQVAKILSDLLQNSSFDVDLESVVDKKNVFSMYYCTANNIDKINNVLFYLCINIKMLIAGIKISKHVHF